MIKKLDHVNLLTPNLEAMVAFYQHTLNLDVGWRPDFDIGGAWLYCQDHPIIHLVDQPDSAGKPAGRIEHFALTGGDRAQLFANLEQADIAYDIVDIPGADAESINFEDPDKNHIEVIFKRLPSASQGEMP